MGQCHEDEDREDGEQGDDDDRLCPVNGARSDDAQNAVASTSAEAKNLVHSVELLSPTTMALAYSPNETATIAPTTTMAVK